jgi:hypothetical protein
MKRDIVIAVLFTLLILSGLWVSSGACQEKPISFKLGHAVAPEHPYRSWGC